jgi:hypothetical protein
MQPDDSEDFGVQLGTLAIRGERGLLIVSQDSLTRIASNPFFPYLLERVEEGIGRQPPSPEGTASQRLGAPVGATVMGSTR